MTTADRFARFADAAALGGSPVYADWATGVAQDAELVALVDRARASQRQPVLVFAVARLLGAPLGSFDELRSWLRGHADDLVAELDRRHTQTNDVRRVGPVAWALSRLLPPGAFEPAAARPVALLEVGASAGLGLYPDRFDVRVGPVRLGDASSAVRMSASTSTGPQDAMARVGGIPPVALRAGLDLAPLDVRDEAAVHWLETLLWPGQGDRVALLRAAVDVARREPPTLLAGDAVDRLDDLVALAPAGTEPVVVTVGTLVYLPGARRQAFVDRVAALGVRWISYERTGLLTGVHATISHPDAAEALVRDSRGRRSSHRRRRRPTAADSSCCCSARALPAPGVPPRRSLVPALGFQGMRRQAMRDDRVNELTEQDRRILDFEQRAPIAVSRKEAAIRTEFGLTGPRYQQLLGSLIEKPGALAYAPMLVGRLLRLRDTRAEARSARSFGR